MRAQALFAAVLSGSIAPAVSQILPSLHDALVAAGASNFAALIQGNANLTALYSSGAIKTVFAPSDSAAIPSSLSKRDAASDQAQLEYQACQDQTNLAETSTGQNGGITFNTGLNSPGLGGGSQKAVGDTRPANATNVSKRWKLSERAANTTTITSLLKIDAGLGAVTNVIKADIAFNGGNIQITDSYFSLPEPLSNTAATTGQTTFNSLAASSNLTSALDSATNITVFLPSNAAFAAVNTATTNVSQLLSNHVVSGFAGYLPALTNGLTLTTQGGAQLTVSVRNNVWTVNGATITQANLVLENGVAHVIDKVLSTPPKPVTTSAGTLAATLRVPSLMCAPLALLVLLF